MKLLKKLILNSFIVSYIFLIYFSGMPASNTLNLKLKKMTEKVTLMIGIWPSWSMFAPNPIKHDSKAIVLIRYKNGVVDEFDVEIEPQGGLGPLRKARWMKYSQDNLTHAGQRQLLNPAINYFYHKFFSEFNPIVSISIKRKWWNVPTFSESDPLIPLLTKVNRAEQSEILVTKQF
jgi:hypothetical protein